MLAGFEGPKGPSQPDDQCCWNTGGRPVAKKRHMNPPGDPRSYHRWSVWRPMDSLGFAENVSEWKWRDDATDALISNVHCALVKCGPRLVHFDQSFIGCMVSADYWLAGYPELRQTTQPSTIGARWSVRRARNLLFLQHWWQSTAGLPGG